MYLALTEETYKIAEENGIRRDLVYRRVIENGWDVSRAIIEPINTKNHATGAWKRWEHISVVTYQNFRTRLSRGWTEAEAALTPARKPRGIGVRKAQDFAYLYAAMDREVSLYG